MAKRDRATGGEAIGDFSDPVLISTLTGWLEASGARELEITTADGRALKIVLAAGRPVAKLPEAVPEQPAGGPEAHAVKAPLAGIFHDRHPAAAGPLAEEGLSLTAGALAGFVEVGPVLLPVRAREAGVVIEVRARAGDLVGYGDTVLLTEAGR